MEILAVFLDNFLKFDVIIFIAAAINGIFYLKVWKNTERLYHHYNASDKMSNLPEEAVENLKKTTSDKEKLSSEDLLDLREKMNMSYAWYSNLTTMFPLFGMLGTVISLIPMVNTIGTTDTSHFFSALTSTFWGIVAALIFKGLDAFVSYKIEDNEKHTEYLLFKK